MIDRHDVKIVVRDSLEKERREEKIVLARSQLLTAGKLWAWVGRKNSIFLSASQGRENEGAVVGEDVMQKKICNFALYVLFSGLGWLAIRRHKTYARENEHAFVRQPNVRTWWKKAVVLVHGSSRSGGQSRKCNRIASWAKKGELLAFHLQVVAVYWTKECCSIEKSLTLTRRWPTFAARAPLRTSVQSPLAWQVCPGVAPAGT